MSNVIELKEKEKVQVNFRISEKVDNELRMFLAGKYGYRKGAYGLEVEKAIKEYLAKEGKNYD